MCFFFTHVYAIIFGTVFWNLGSIRSTRKEVFKAMDEVCAFVLFSDVTNFLNVKPTAAMELFDDALIPKPRLVKWWNCNYFKTTISDIGHSSQVPSEQWVIEYVGLHHGWLGYNAPLLLAFAILQVSTEC